MLSWIRSLLRWFCGERSTTNTPQQSQDRDFFPSGVAIRRYVGVDGPPPMHWKACHPSTVSRFKAEMTCSGGHALVLRNHSIGTDGSVKPSVVCMAAGCSFHDFVRLEGWTGGPIG